MPVISSNEIYSTHPGKNTLEVLPKLHRPKSKPFPFTIPDLLVCHDGCSCEANDLLPDE